MKRPFSRANGDDGQPPAEWDDLVGGADGGSSRDRASPAFVIGVIGDSGSGKSTFAAALANLFGRDRVTDLRLDDYHRFTREERTQRGLSALNPAVHNLALMREHLASLRAGRPITNRTYRHEDGSFGPVQTIEPREVIVARGLLGIPDPSFRDLYDLSVFLRPEPELLFRWKLRRDVLFRGYTEAQVLKNIADQLLDAKEFVVPQADLADVVIEYALPDPDASDDEVRTTVRARGRVGALAASNGLLEGMPIQGALEGDDLVLTIPPRLPQEVVERWAREHVSRKLCDAAGACDDEDGGPRRRAPLAMAELVVVYLAELVNSG